MRTSSEPLKWRLRLGRGHTKPLEDEEREPGRYLTDGVNLYRFLGLLGWRANRLVGIENCRSLDVMLVPVEELRRKRFRSVAIAE